ncbi:MAG: methyl-accepting chemotaxis protein [Paracraurococcus sp.]
MQLLRNASIGRKISGALALMILLSGLLGAASLRGLGQVNAAAEDIRVNWLPSVKLLGQYGEQVTLYRLRQANLLLTGDAAMRQTITRRLADARQAAEKAWTAYEPLVTPGEETALAEAIRGAWRDYVALEDRLAAAQARDDVQARALFVSEMATAFDRLTMAVNRDLEFNVEATRQQTLVASHAFETGRMLVLGCLGTSVLAGALIVWLMTRGVSRPLAESVGLMERIARGELHFAVPDKDRRDEIGTIGRALDQIGVALRGAAELRQEQEALKRKAEQERREALLGLANTLESSVGGVVEGIASATTELSAAATSMVDIAESTSTRAATVSGATSLASGNVGTVAAATEELAASVAEISRQVADSARMAAGAVDQANRTNTTVANLTEAAAKIGEVTRLIGDIAGQTNLLALNATIEAARAGEAGKGFAVVASEVKALANQTAQATGSIATQIQAMQAATQDAAADIGAIRESIGQINQVTAAIAAAVEEQGAATRDIAENVQRAAQGTAEITSAIEGVTAAAGETGGAASQVQATSASLAQQAETLRAEVGNFLGRVRAA